MPTSAKLKLFASSYGTHGGRELNDYSNTIFLHWCAPGHYALAFLKLLPGILITCASVHPRLIVITDRGAAP